MKYLLAFLIAGIMGFYFGTQQEMKVDLTEETVKDKVKGSVYTMYEGTINGKRSVCMELDTPDLSPEAAGIYLYHPK